MDTFSIWEKYYNRNLVQQVKKTPSSTWVQIKTLPLFPSAQRLTPASSWRPTMPTAWQWTLWDGTTSTRRFSSRAVQTGPSRSGTIPSSKITKWMLDATVDISFPFWSIHIHFVPILFYLGLSKHRLQCYLLFSLIKLLFHFCVAFLALHYFHFLYQDAQTYCRSHYWLSSRHCSCWL